MEPTFSDPTVKPRLFKRPLWTDWTLYVGQVFGLFPATRQVLAGDYSDLDGAGTAIAVVVDLGIGFLVGLAFSAMFAALRRWFRRRNDRPA